MKEAWIQVHATHSIYQGLARAAQCGRVPVDTICRCLNAPDIDIAHLTEDGSECVREAQVVVDEEHSDDVLKDASSDEEDYAPSDSEWDGAFELSEELGSDYEDEEAVPS